MSSNAEYLRNDEAYATEEDDNAEEMSEINMCPFCDKSDFARYANLVTHIKKRGKACLAIEAAKESIRQAELEEEEEACATTTTGNVIPSNNPKIKQLQDTMIKLYGMMRDLTVAVGTSKNSGTSVRSAAVSNVSVVPEKFKCKDIAGTATRNGEQFNVFYGKKGAKLIQPQSPDKTRCVEGVKTVYLNSSGVLTASFVPVDDYEDI